MYKLCLLIALLFLTGCNNRIDLAPVSELRGQPHNIYQTTHRVRAGETLYAIAFRYDQDFRQLATLNGLYSPYFLRVGQLLKIKPVGSYARAQQRYSIAKRPARQYPYANKIKRLPKPRQIKWFNKSAATKNWVWPVTGRIAAQFIPLQGKKGIDIAGRKGEKVRAAGNGVVAYAGSGLNGYGNLIIIKHNDQFLTAYGNNLKNNVKEGQRVKAGQIIAEIGMIDRRFWGVHFEIRKAGKPVNPLAYLR